ncbi:hypothetical protein CEXT_730131 [Caerostris extrusa]|uniref:Uncharacterized protein n=1 Tax=Caerostris extrusa TaxID=172846 RepID=A0AAV4N969_CAEEX|nr:hypothetical protein CEXT_730131 [Caerostris extrusa]
MNLGKDDATMIMNKNMDKDYATTTMIMNTGKDCATTNMIMNLAYFSILRHTLRDESRKRLDSETHQQVFSDSQHKQIFTIFLHPPSSRLPQIDFSKKEARKGESVCLREQNSAILNIRWALLMSVPSRWEK